MMIDYLRHRADCFAALRVLRSALEAARRECEAAGDGASVEAATDALCDLAQAEICIADISDSEESVVECRVREV